MSGGAFHASCERHQLHLVSLQPAMWHQFQLRQGRAENRRQDAALVRSISRRAKSVEALFNAWMQCSRMVRLCGPVAGLGAAQQAAAPHAYGAWTHAALGPGKPHILGCTCMYVLSICRSITSVARPSSPALGGWLNCKPYTHRHVHRHPMELITNQIRADLFSH